jgi:hypothetical protein
MITRWVRNLGLNVFKGGSADVTATDTARGRDLGLSVSTINGSYAPRIARLSEHISHVKVGIGGTDT